MFIHYIPVKLFYYFHMKADILHKLFFLCVVFFDPGVALFYFCALWHRYCQTLDNGGAGHVFIYLHTASQGGW